jgi:chemotaxis protein methyltransferase CheR
MKRRSESGSRATPRASAPSLPLVDALMREHTGLTVRHFSDEERWQLMAAAMRKAGFSDDSAYALFLRTYPSSLLDLAGQLSVGETYFFRDPGQLRVLTDEVLPRLLVARSKDHVLKLWSAGCASGEEAYTLAMLLDERGLLERAEIVGTDISEVALARARAGRYSAWSLRATPKLAAQRYFRAHGRDYTLSPTIASRVRFQRQGLTDVRAPLPGGFAAPFDVIFCRNVLIYFTDEACREASLRLAQALTPGGTLFAGASDPFVDLPLWQRVATPVSVTFSRVQIGSARASDNALGAAPVPGPLRHSPTPLEPASAEQDLASLTQRAARADAHAQRPLASARPVQAVRSTEVPRVASAKERPLDSVREVGKREGSERAIEACRRALAESPEAIDLHLWLSALLLELGRDAEAEISLRTLLYLDRKLIMGHLLSALLARRQADHARAARAYQRVLALCADHDDDEPVPMGEGLDHRTLAENAAAELRALDKLGRSS